MVYVPREFGAGKAAMIFDASNCMCQVDFQKMAETGNIGYTTMPVAKKGDKFNSNFWTWSMAMNSYSKHKGAAWTFLQYFTARSSSGIPPWKPTTWIRPGPLSTTTPASRQRSTSSPLVRSVDEDCSLDDDPVHSSEGFLPDYLRVGRDPPGPRRRRQVPLGTGRLDALKKLQDGLVQE
jgi:hypothetical protein